MSGPGPKIDWLADTLARTNNSINPAQVAPTITLTAGLEANDVVEVAVSIDPPLANVPCLVWASTVGGTPSAMDAIVPTEFGIPLGTVGETVLMLVSDGTVIEVGFTGELDGLLFVLCLINGQISSAPVVFEGVEP